MKVKKYTAASRGFINHGWLQANYSFSFSSYFDPERVQFGKLRVLNDDLIAPSMGFGKHPHKNMEIITIPLGGELKHKDSMSNEWLYVKPNEVQVMSAGTGIFHSEMNALSDKHLSLFQIWIMPNEDEVTPRYNQASFDPSERKNKLQILVSDIDDKNVNGLKLHQNAQISRIDLDENSDFTYMLKSKNNGVYVMNISGAFSIENEEASSRDALTVEDVDDFKISSKTASEILFIEVPMQ